MKKLYSKKYGLFIWLKRYADEPAKLVSLNVRGLSEYVAKIYTCKENLEYRLKYFKGKVKEYGLKFEGEPFIVRITGKKVKMKTGTLILDWGHKTIGCDNHEYVPWKFIPDFDGSSK